MIDQRLIFKNVPTWFGFAAAGGTSNVAEDRCIRREYLLRPSLFFERVVYPQLDYLDANDQPLAIIISDAYGYENTEQAKDFDAPIEASRNPNLDRWCDELPGHLDALSLVTDHLGFYVGTAANDPDMQLARQVNLSEYAARTYASLEPFMYVADSITFDQVCQLTDTDPVYRDMLRIRRRLGVPCFAESRPDSGTTQWMRDRWGFMFQERHLLLRGSQWVPLAEIRKAGCPIARMTTGVPDEAHVDPQTGQKWEPWAWQQHAIRSARADGDSVTTNLRNLAAHHMRLGDFE